MTTIVIEPVTKPDVDTDIKIDNHLVSMGCRLSKSDMLQRYGRTEATSDDDVAEQKQQTQPGLGGFGGLPNEKVSPAPAGQIQAAGQQSQGQDADKVSRKLLESFASDTGPAADAIKELLNALESGADAKAEAASLVSRLPSLMPDDPAMAAVIAEAMAKEFGEAELPNEIANPCPKCHRNMPKGGTCSFCAKRAANHTAGKSAFDEVAKTHKDKVGAMERDSIGKIDFIWGDDTEGICHILGEHPGDAQMIPGVIAYGDIYEDTVNGKYYAVKKRNLVVLRKREGGNHYLITGYRKDDPNAIAKIRREYNLVEKGE